MKPQDQAASVERIEAQSLLQFNHALFCALTDDTDSAMAALEIAIKRASLMYGRSGHSAQQSEQETRREGQGPTKKRRMDNQQRRDKETTLSDIDAVIQELLDHVYRDSLERSNGPQEQHVGCRSSRETLATILVSSIQLYVLLRFSNPRMREVNVATLKQSLKATGTETSAKTKATVFSTLTAGIPFHECVLCRPHTGRAVSHISTFLLGAIYWREGMFTEASQAIDNALQVSPNFPPALYLKGNLVRESHMS